MAGTPWCSIPGLAERLTLCTISVPQRCPWHPQPLAEKQLLLPWAVGIS